MKPSGWTAIVLGEHQASLASPRDATTAPVKAGACNDAVHTLNRAADLIRGTGSGVLMLAGGALLRDVWAGQRGPLADAGWSCTEIQPWTTWSRRDAPRIHVGFLGLIDQDRTPLFRVDDPPPSIARRLAWYHEAMGGPWHMTGGVSGHAIIRNLYRKPGKGQQPYWGTRDRREPTDTRQGAGDLIWRRPPMRGEVEMGWVHAFDLNAARLSAMGVAEVAYDRLSHTGPIVFDPALAGYWEIHARDVTQHKRHVPIFPPEAVHNGLVDVTTPIMSHLLAKGISPEVADSWTAPGRRMFRSLAEAWNAARLHSGSNTWAGSAAELDAVKATYREAAGLFARAGGSIFRPDWYHTWMDRQRVTVIGHVNRITLQHERRPLAIHTDCLWYAATEADPREAAAALGIKLGHGLGMFRVHSSAPAEAFFTRKAA